jgi:hypothetical protein
MLGTPRYTLHAKIQCDNLGSTRGRFNPQPLIDNRIHRKVATVLDALPISEQAFRGQARATTEDKQVRILTSCEARDPLKRPREIGKGPTQ